MFWLSYVILGAGAGVLAGLLGVGGGIIIVPVLTFLFAAQHLPGEYNQHLALGTSLASIMCTSISSMRAHHARDGVDWAVVLRISPGILSGTLLGAAVAAQLSTGFLKIFFVIFLLYVSIQMILDIKPKPHRQPPGLFGMFGVGSLIGGISSLVGIGGGTMSVPFMLWCNFPLRRAIGTSAAIGFPIAVAGTVGYALNGYRIADLPHYSCGFVYLPAFAGISIASILCAPLGVRLAHLLAVARLKKGFALFLIVMGVKMAYSLFYP
jgi:uncharacterized membrane protein YfcA